MVRRRKRVEGRWIALSGLGGTALAAIALIGFSAPKIGPAFAVDTVTEDWRQLRMGKTIPLSSRIVIEEKLADVAPFRPDLKVERVLYRRTRLLNARRWAPEEADRQLREAEIELLETLGRFPVSGRAWLALAQLAADRNDRHWVEEGLRRSYVTGPFDRYVAGPRLEFALTLDPVLTAAFVDDIQRDAHTFLRIPGYRRTQADRLRMARIELDPQGKALLDKVRPEPKRRKRKRRRKARAE